MANPVAVFETSVGTFRAEIFLEQMPITAGNFLSLVRAGFYDGLHFHRVIRDFMVQFGCPFSRDPFDPRAGTGGSPSGCIPDEHLPAARFSNTVGTLAMANTGRPNSGGSQFFINTADNFYLDWFSPGVSKHPVFGRVVEGMEVVRAIEATPTGPGDRPKTPVKMIRIVVEQ